MNILVVGGAGYVGGYLTDLLLDHHDKVTVYDNLLYETRYLKPVRFIYGDIRDYPKLKEALKNQDAVIWLAGIVGDAACALAPEKTVEINQKTVEWLCRNFDGKIIFTSTCSVYGANNDLLTEDAPCNPLSVYASTKLAAEQIIQNRSDNHVIFRLGTLFGVGDTLSRIRLDLVVNVLTQRAVMTKKIQVFGGTQWRPLLHVKDVGRAANYALRPEIKGTFNVHRENYQIKDLGHQVAMHVTGTTIEYQNMHFEDLRNYRVSSDKFRRASDKGEWKPKFTLDEGILEMKQLMIENRIKNVNDPVYTNVAALRQMDFKNG